MQNTGYATNIVTVMVTVSGKLLDCVSFSSEAQAEAYKTGVRRWALERGVIVNVWTQAMEVARKNGRRTSLAAAV